MQSFLHSFPFRYVEGLENRLEKLEKLLKRVRLSSSLNCSPPPFICWQKLCPDEKVLRELDIAIDKQDFLLDQLPVDPSPLVSSTKKDQHENIQPIVDLATSVLRRYGTADHHNDDHSDDDAHLIITENLKQLSLEPKEYRFFGKSSGAMLIKTAMELKNEYSGQVPATKPGLLGLKRNEFWTSRPVRLDVSLISPSQMLIRSSGKMSCQQIHSPLAIPFQTPIS